ncbi:MAG: c-type cytochrome [Verrucomicrobiales bacterium]|nr:c-type cytochrome [Verrucomicrobiales bacterium]
MKMRFFITTLTLAASLAISLSTATAVPAETEAAAKTKKTPKNKSKAEIENEAKLRIANFEIPEGFVTKLFADESQTQNCSAICFDSKGRLYIAELPRWKQGVEDIRDNLHMLFEDNAIQSSADRLAMYKNHASNRPLSHYNTVGERIVVVEDSDHDGRADKHWIFADGFKNALDGPGIGLLDLGKGKMLYTNIPHLWLLEDKNGDGKADRRTSLQDGFGIRMSYSGHDLHGLVRGPDGRIYFSLGDRGYSFTTKEGRTYHEPARGAVFRCDPDGSNLEEYYRGLRNPQELAFDQFGNLFTCDNNGDQWDKGRLVYILEGGDSGWTAGHQSILNFHQQLKLRTQSYAHPERKSIPMTPWLTEALWETQHQGQPAWILPPIDTISWGPSGFVFNYGGTAFPERYKNHFFVCNFGGSRADIETFGVETQGAGFKSTDHHIFMKAMGLTDLEFGPDGKMYMSCFNNNGWSKQDVGNVYTLADEKLLKSQIVLATQKLLLTPFEDRSNAELDQLLAHPDMRVRQKAQFALVEKNLPATTEILKNAAVKKDNPLLKRLHGIWGLGQLSRQHSDLLTTHITLLKDEQVAVRTQAAKVLADSRTLEAGVALLAALDDESAQVQAQAAIGVGKCRNAQALDKLFETLTKNNNQDVFLRHACVMGLWYLNQKEKMLKQMDNESPALRLGLLLTLRRLKDPRVEYFLSDPDPKIVAAAIRAINDENLEHALPALAKHLEKYITLEDDTALPKGHRDFIQQTRLINANFRLGKNENAKRLLDYAANAQLPEFVRLEALNALAEWPQPNVIDSTLGVYRPLDVKTRDDITKTVQAGLPAVLKNAHNSLLATATRLAGQYQFSIPGPLLIQQLENQQADPELRIVCLQQLTRSNAPELTALLPTLLNDKKTSVRKEALVSLLKTDPARGTQEVLKFAQSKNLRDRQNSYSLMASTESPEVTQWLSLRLTTLIAGKEPAATQLDLIEAAAKSTDPGILKKLKTYTASLDPKNILAAYQVCLEGGDAAKGRTVYTNHPSGQCSKCHTINRNGGIAGPDLSAVGSRQKADYLLESLVSPSASVVPGYGLTMVTLKDGNSIGGNLLEENDQYIVVKFPDPKDSTQSIERKIPLTEIQSRQPPISAMPPAGLLMSKYELRDLIAYLQSLKK